MKLEYSILVGGAAGQGSRKAGLVIAKLFNKLGYNIYIYDDYQSLIKGGHNFSQITAAEEPANCRKEKIDFLLALDKKTITAHRAELKSGGLLFLSGDGGGKEGIAIPAEKIVKDLGGLPIMANTALIAGFAKAIGIEWKTVKEVLEKEIDRELEKNIEIAEAAYSQTQALFKIEKIKARPKMLLTGNEATALGFAKAGLDIYFAYPMTPASSILHYFAEHQKELGVLAIQPENEIAVASEAVGAGFAGKRAAVGTSGGGFALMAETISLSAESETPLVIVNSQRMGPATGVPTYSAQADLLFTLSAGHGDFERFVIAPSNAEESFYWAGKILNLAWKYQSPAILLLDKEVSEGTFSVDKGVSRLVKKEKESLWGGKSVYQRYKDTVSGISPMAFPGEKGAIIKGNSYEHNEAGITMEEKQEEIQKMQEKRLRKFEGMQKEIDDMDAIKIYGNKKSKTAVIAWGSVAGVAREAVSRLGFKMVQPIVLSPFPEKQFKKALQRSKKIIVAEANALGQLSKVLSGYGIKANKKILKYNSRPFTEEELEKQLKKA
ncbi:MAG: 2-oxoacid:acceptor oxidoreductase subunit alpha [Candidatus Pacebacteria bacterium]|nr:2-oxoacid:acceptor oxidoreductase subunit alpha [Candidatus Paceibacterota bacterium]